MSVQRWRVIIERIVRPRFLHVLVRIHQQPFFAVQSIAHVKFCHVLARQPLLIEESFARQALYIKHSKRRGLVHFRDPLQQGGPPGDFRQHAARVVVLSLKPFLYFRILQILQPPVRVGHLRPEILLRHRFHRRYRRRCHRRRVIPAARPRPQMPRQRQSNSNPHRGHRSPHCQLPCFHGFTSLPRSPRPTRRLPVALTETAAPKVRLVAEQLRVLHLERSEGAAFLFEGLAENALPQVLCFGGAIAPPAAAVAAPIAPSSPSTFTSPAFDGTMYLVLFTSVLLNTSSRRIASARSLKNVSAAVETSRIASASALARVMRACASPSAFKISDCLKPSACRIWLCLTPSDSSTAARLSRSAFICRDIASVISRGGSIFCTSTRVTFTPQLFVASSST